MNSQQQRSRQSYMFLALLILLWGLMICFVSYQYSRERQFKVDMLNTSLQQLNYHLMDEYGVLGSVDDLYNRNAKRYGGVC
ncbi:MAG: hypothetical protein SNH80_08220, partial [Rikenellaceae bacterium]